MKKRPRKPATLGFSPHSGWAALVALGGAVRSPEVLLRKRIEMADPELLGSKQPYHELEGMEVRKAEGLLERYVRTATAMARAEIQAVVEDLEGRGYLPTTAGILQASGRQGSSLEAILGSHALIHAAEGEHFRNALAEASEGCGLAVIRVRGRDLADQSAAVLRRRADELLGRVREMGRLLGPPWGADQKAAALLAWLALRARP